MGVRVVSDDLVKRLRALQGTTPDSLGIATMWYWNPDGPEAADTIERLTAENERLREAGTNLAGFALHDFGCLHWERNDSCDCGYTLAWKTWDGLLAKHERKEP